MDTENLGVMYNAPSCERRSWNANGQADACDEKDGRDERDGKV